MLVMDMYSQLENALSALELKVSSATCDESIILTAQAPRKTVKIKLPIQEYLLMGVDVLLIDLEKNKQYVAYETELDSKTLASTLTDLEVIVAKFLAGNYKTKHSKSFFGLINNYALEFDVNGVVYSYSEILNKDCTERGLRI